MLRRPEPPSNIIYREGRDVPAPPPIQPSRLFEACNLENERALTDSGTMEVQFRHRPDSRLRQPVADGVLRALDVLTGGSPRNMKPLRFPEQNATYAEDQPEYGDLPAFREPDGAATSCWGLSWWDRLRVLLTGRVWVTVLTFNKPLQPMVLRTWQPFLPEETQR